MSESGRIVGIGKESTDEVDVVDSCCKVDGGSRLSGTTGEGKGELE